MKKIIGVDLSHWQGKVDFKKVHSDGISVAFLKATEGSMHRDYYYESNRSSALSAGLCVGTYHYFSAVNCSPEQQRDNIIDTITSVGFDALTEYFAVDVERGGNELATPDLMAESLFRLLFLLEKEPILRGRKPMIYCSSNFWDNYISGDKYSFSEYPLWIAHWKTESPVIPKTWSQAGKNWTGWQYTNEGVVNGIGGKVDMDIFLL